MVIDVYIRICDTDAMSNVIARDRYRMYTAFVHTDGRSILNISDIVDGMQQCVSIEIDPASLHGIATGDHDVVERLLHSAPRLVQALPTPPASIPVGTTFAQAA